MVSENAKQALDRIFARAAGACLAMNPGDAVAVERLPGPGLAELPGRHLLVLTISSYRFRLLTVFHVDADGAAGRYFVAADSGSELTAAFAEAFGEVGNLCCGTMNRELGKHFMHTGMSTPYLLERACAGYLHELKPAHLAQYRIAINDGIALHATLCLCAYGAIDFRADPDAAEAEETGALELF